MPLIEMIPNQRSREMLGGLKTLDGWCPIARCPQKANTTKCECVRGVRVRVQHSAVERVHGLTCLVDRVAKSLRLSELVAQSHAFQAQ